MHLKGVNTWAEKRTGVEGCLHERTMCEHVCNLLHRAGSMGAMST